MHELRDQVGHIARAAEPSHFLRERGLLRYRP
jgi:hypothetical protein